MRFLFILFMMIISNKTTGQVPSGETLPAGAAPYVTLLREVMHGQQEWVKVHAAEYLLWSGYPDGVKEAFVREEKQFGTKPQYRVGIWRVLVQSPGNESERVVWLNRMKSAFLDVDGPDRIHAAETLAKLHVSMAPEAPKVTRDALESPVEALALYTLWGTANGPAEIRKAVIGKLIKNLTLLTNTQGAIRSISAYALRQIGGLDENQWWQLSESALKEPDSSPAKVFLLSAAWLTSVHPDGPTSHAFKTALLRYKTADTKGERSEMAMALAAKGNAGDLPLLKEMFENKHPLGDPAADADVMAAAAYAILKIKERER